MTVHMKLNYHVDEDIMDIMGANMEASQSYFLVSMKLHHGTNIK